MKIFTREKRHNLMVSYDELTTIRRAITFSIMGIDNEPRSNSIAIENRGKLQALLDVIHLIEDK